MIRVCERHASLLGVRYDPKHIPADRVRCPLCGAAPRAQRPGDRFPNIVTAKREATP